MIAQHPTLGTCYGRALGTCWGDARACAGGECELRLRLRSTPANRYPLPKPREPLRHPSIRGVKWLERGETTALQRVDLYMVRERGVHLPVPLSALYADRAGDVPEFCWLLARSACRGRTNRSQTRDVLAGHAGRVPEFCAGDVHAWAVRWLQLRWLRNSVTAVARKSEMGRWLGEQRG